MSDPSVRAVPEGVRELDIIGVRNGAFGVAGSGDTSGFGGLVEPIVMPGPTARPFGGWFDEATDELLRSLDDHRSPVVFVSNELGLGLVPETPLGRSFRDAMGRMNMRVAERAHRVIFMAAGLPLVMKDRPAG